MSTQRSQLLKEFKLLAASVLVAQAARFFVALYAAHILGPKDWGLWSLISLVIAYAPIAHLGVVNAINREIAYMRGNGESSGVTAVTEVALGWTLIASAIGALAIVIMGNALGKDNWFNETIALAILFFVTLVNLWAHAYLKSTLKFSLYSHQQLVSSALIVIMAVTIVPHWHLTGYMAVLAAAMGTPLLFLFKLGVLEFRARLDFQLVRNLIKIGFPIMSAGIMFSALTTIDRCVIATYLGSTSLGYYSLGLQFMMAAQLLPMMVAQQVYPRMAEEWGRTSHKKSIARWSQSELAFSVSLTVPVCGTLGLIAGPLVRFVFPDYVPGIDAIYPLLLCPIAVALASGSANVMNTINRQYLYMGIQTVAFVALILADFVAVWLELGIEGIAWATAIVMWLYALTMKVFARRALDSL